MHSSEVRLNNTKSHLLRQAGDGNQGPKTVQGVGKKSLLSVRAGALTARQNLISPRVGALTARQRFKGRWLNLCSATVRSGDLTAQLFVI